jgi:TM2 domain-containing membrane protein YozV
MKGLGDKYCFECAEVLPRAAPACWRCSAPQPALYEAVPTATPSYATDPTPNPRADTQKRSKIAAAVIALFLGGLGLHRFYLGRPWSGLFYFLFCWTFIPMILSFVEAIVLIAMSEERFAEAYP